MTKDELATILDRCRQRVTRLGIMLGSFGLFCGIAAIATIVVRSQGRLSRESFLVIAFVILFVNFVAFFWGLWKLRQVPTACGALCPNCGASLIAQRDKVLTTCVCVECNSSIVERPN